MEIIKNFWTYFVLFFWWSEAFGKKTQPVDRLYHLGAVPQGIQYYASGSPNLIYPNIPAAAVYIPGQVGVLNLPPGVTVQSAAPNTPPTEATPTYHTPYPSRPAHPAYYHQQQGSSSFSIEQSVDLSDNSKIPGSVSTYGPPKALDVPYRRPQSPSSHHRTYNRYKNYPPFPPRGPSRPGGRPMMYTHYHKGHLHTHYIPSSVPTYKPSKHAYLPTTTPLPPPGLTPSTEDPHKIYNHHAHPSPASAQSSNLVRFPSSSHEDLTQAVIGQTGVINNYDASLPVKIPNKKPNQLEVRDILKNADFHFVDVLENKPTTSRPQIPLYHSTPKPELANHQHHLQSFRPSTPAQEYLQPQNQFPGFPQQEERYPIQQVFHQPQQADQMAFSYPAQGFHQNQIRNYAELYDHRFQVPQAFHSNHLEQDNGPSETYKVPVAIFKGVLPGMIPIPVERSDEDTEHSSSLPADFTPSKRISDWIPVTGGGSQAIHSKPESVRNLDQFGDDYFADLSKQSSIESSKFSPKDHQQSYIIDTSESNGHQNFPVAEKLTRNPEDTIYGTTSSNFENVRVKNEKVGDIISGKIPGSHNPFGKIGERNQNNLNSGITTSSGNIRDGSNLVVSSVIKFSK